MIWLLLANFALRTAFVLVLASGVAWLLRNQSAAMRHALWASALAISLLLGPLSLVPPILRIPVDSRSQAQVPGVFDQPSRPLAADVRAARPFDRGDFAARPTPRLGPDLAAVGRRAVAALPLLWLIGALVGLVRIVRSRVRLGRLRRDARPISDDRILAVFGELGRGNRRPRLLSSEALRTPVAFGVGQPSVILPAGAGSWPRARLRVVLAHELSHVRRRDALTQLVAELAKAVHWYNPLVWHAVNRLTFERERACDDEVVEGGARSLDYAGHLVSMAGNAVRERRGPRSVLTMAEVSGLEARVTALLTPALRRGRLTRMQFSLVALPSLLAVPVLVLIGGAPLDAASLRAVAPVALDAPALDRAEQARPGSRPVSLPAAPSARQPVTPPIDRPIEVVSSSPPNAFDSPASELVPLTGPRNRWPSEAEIRSSPERALIERLRAAADHQKTWEYDLVADRATWALTRVRNGEIVAPLVASLADPDWRIQAYAAWALAAIDAPGAAAPIRRLLDHSNWRVRAQAASSLLEFRQAPSMDELRTLARDPAWQVRISAVEFLRQDGGPEASAVLEQMRGDAHGGTRMQVEAALSELAAR